MPSNNTIVKNPHACHAVIATKRQASAGLLKINIRSCIKASLVQRLGQKYWERNKCPGFYMMKYGSLLGLIFKQIKVLLSHSV